MQGDPNFLTDPRALCFSRDALRSAISAVRLCPRMPVAAPTVSVLCAQRAPEPLACALRQSLARPRPLFPHPPPLQRLSPPRCRTRRALAVAVAPIAARIAACPRPSDPYSAMSVTMEQMLESVTDAISAMVIFASEASNNAAVLKNLAAGATVRYSFSLVFPHHAHVCSRADRAFRQP